MRIKSSFHINNFALSLALKERRRTTQKWPIVSTFSQYLIYQLLKFLKFPWQIIPHECGGSIWLK